MHFGELLRDCDDEGVGVGGDDDDEEVNESFERKTFLVRSLSSCLEINGDDNNSGCGEGKSIFMDPSWVRIAFIFVMMAVIKIKILLKNWEIFFWRGKLIHIRQLFT